LNMTFSV